jgi:hypothetical protein
VNGKAPRIQGVQLGEVPCDPEGAGCDAGGWWAKGPLGERGGSIILAVILHLDIKQVKNNS